MSNNPNGKVPNARLPLGNTREDLEFDELSEKYMENMNKGTLSPENAKNESRREKSARKNRLDKLAKLKASGNLFLPNSGETYGHYPLDPRLNKLQKRAEEVARRNEWAAMISNGYNRGRPKSEGNDSSPGIEGDAPSPPPGYTINKEQKKKTPRRLRKNRRSRKRNTRR